MERHRFSVFILLIMIALLGCSFRDIEGDSADRKPDFADSPATPTDQEPVQTARYNDEEVKDDRDSKLSFVNAGISSIGVEPILTGPNGVVEAEELIEAEEEYFRNQTKSEFEWLECEIKQWASSEADRRLL